MSLAMPLKTVAMVTGTCLSIQEMLYFTPYSAWTMLCENKLFVTEIVKEAGNFSLKILQKVSSRTGDGSEN